MGGPVIASLPVMGSLPIEGAGGAIDVLAPQTDVNNGFSDPTKVQVGQDQ